MIKILNKILPALLILNLGSANYSAQNSNEYFPGYLNVQPFTANILEPDLGFIFKLKNDELRLNISNSRDIVQWKRSDIIYSLGADLFTYTLLRREKEFHFPVDAVDYLFGLNFGIKKNLGSREIGARIRLSHISAHFVDGHFDSEKNEWRDGRKPRVYSREFIELMPFIKINNLRTYAGLTYVFHIDPGNLGKWNFQFGGEYYFNKILNVFPFAAYDFRLTKINKYSGNNSVKAGIKIGKRYGRGFSIFYSFYSGKSIHGEYFDLNTKFSAIGFNLDL